MAAMVREIMPTKSAGNIIAYAERQAHTIGPVLGSGAHAVSDRIVATLPRALAALVRSGMAAPLSLLYDLIACSGNRPPLGDMGHVREHLGMARLVKLGWPTEARVALALVVVALMEREAGWRPAPAFVPPPAGSPMELQEALVHALTGPTASAATAASTTTATATTAASVAATESTPEEVPGTAATAAIAAVGRVLDRVCVDAGLLTMLRGLGADACAGEPAMPLMFLDRLDEIVALGAPERALLERPMPSELAGEAEGTMLGIARQGVTHHGDLRELVPSTWALPADVRAYRYSQGELLYRAQVGREMPQLRPTVLVLDVSAPCLGPIAGILRPAAFCLSRALLAAGEPGYLLAAGGDNSARPLQHVLDMFEILTAQTLAPVDPERTLRQAQGLRETLAGTGALEPVIVLMSHVYFGAEHRELAAPAHLRAVFAQYPRHPHRPAWHDRCERWQALAPDNPDAIPEAVARIME